MKKKFKDGAGFLDASKKSVGPGPESPNKKPGINRILLFFLISSGIALGLAAVFSPLYAFGFFGLALIVIVVFYDIRIGLLVLLLSSALVGLITPLFRYRFANLHFSHLLSILLLVVFVIQASRRGNPSPRTKTNIDTPLILLLFISIVSLLNSYLFWDPAVSLAHRHLLVQLAGVALFLIPISVFVILVRRIDTDLWLKILYYSLIALTFFAALLSVGSKLIRADISDRGGVYIDMGILYTVGFSLGFAGFLFSKNNRHRLVWGLLCAPIVLDIAQFSAFGERTLVAIVASTVVLAFLRSKKAFVLVLFLLALLIVVKSSFVQDLIFSPTESLHFRLILWKDTLNVLSQHWSYWLVGVGPGNYYAYSLVYTFNAISYGAWGLTTPHSQYFMILGELGVFGLFVFFWFLVNAFRTQITLFSQARDHFSKVFSAGALGAFAGIAVLCILADSLIPSISNMGFDRICTSLYPWILLGIVYGKKRMNKESGERRKRYE